MRSWKLKRPVDDGFVNYTTLERAVAAARTRFVSWPGNPTNSAGVSSKGRIRDGHGDLRLEHVYFEGAEPIVVDCVEFNERLPSFLV